MRAAGRPIVASPKHRRLTPTALGAGVLALALVLVNALAAWGIVAARRDAQRAAQQELELRTLAQARALEAAIASLRADLIFLSRSPTLVRLAGEVAEPDPLVRRWNRLDAEGTVLLFLEANPAIEHVVLRRTDGPLLRGGRQQGAPLLLPLGAPAPSSPESMSGRWSLETATGAELLAWVDPRVLLPSVGDAGLGVSLSLEPDATASAPSPPPGAAAASPRLATTGGAAATGSASLATGRDLIASVPVTDEGWTPPSRWRLVRREERGDLVRSLDALAGRFGATVALNLAVMASSLGLGWWTLRNLRRTARLEAEREQQARVRELERQVLHSERLASVGRLAAGFAHEINNPLEGISNYLAVLRDELDSGRTREARPLVDRAAEGVNRAAGVIRQILAFSEPGSAAKETLDLRQVLETTASFVRSNPRYREADLRLTLGSSPLLVHGNAVTLGQLALNLLLNALQAEPATGPVEVSVTGAPGEPIVLEVRDRGPGVAAAVRDRLFEPFTSTRGSTGLGLAVCRGIVEDHGGRIELRDREGGGAVAAVSLPAAPGEATVPPLLIERRSAS
jgi:signal transduction histidine kinase